MTMSGILKSTCQLAASIAVLVLLGACGAEPGPDAEPAGATENAEAAAPVDEVDAPVARFSDDTTIVTPVGTFQDVASLPKSAPPSLRDDLECEAIETAGGAPEVDGAQTNDRAEYSPALVEELRRLREKNGGTK